mgnify:CR=1 FL=1
MFRHLEKNTSLATGLRLIVVVLLFTAISLVGYLVFSNSYHNKYTKLKSRELSVVQTTKKVSAFEAWAPFSYSVSPTTTVPIWYYHHIRYYNNPADANGQALSVSPETFREQLHWMFENNYTTITPEQLLQLFNGHLILPIGKKPAMITFDDGYDNMLTEAYPILKEFNFTGLFFVCPGLLNNPGYLTSEQIKFLDKNGMSFGGHTMTHVDLKASDQATQFREMKESKDELEILLGHSIISMAYPYGMFDTKTKGITRKAGYTISMSTLPGFADSKEDWMQLTRVRMYESKDFRRVLPQ